MFFSRCILILPDDRLICFLTGNEIRVFVDGKKVWIDYREGGEFNMDLGLLIIKCAQERNSGTTGMFMR